MNIFIEPFQACSDQLLLKLKIQSYMKMQYFCVNDSIHQITRMHV